MKEKVCVHVKKRWGGGLEAFLLLTPRSASVEVYFTIGSAGEGKQKNKKKKQKKDK